MAESLHVSENFVFNVEQLQGKKPYIFNSMRLHASEDDDHLEMQKNFLDSEGFPKDFDFNSFDYHNKSNLDNISSILTHLISDLSDLQWLIIDINTKNKLSG